MNVTDSTTATNAPAAPQRRRSALASWLGRLRFWGRAAEHRDCAKLDLDAARPHDSVMALCDCLLDQYLAWKMENLRAGHLALKVAIIFGAFTPVMLLLPVESAKLLGAITSAIAASASGLLAAFGWRENHLRYGDTWHALQAERRRYLLRAAPSYSQQQSPAEAAAVFANQMDVLVTAEVSGWRTMMHNLQNPRPKGEGE